MRNEQLYKSVETLAQAAYGLLDTPAEGLTLTQAAALRRKAQGIIRSIDRLNQAIHGFVDENSIEMLKERP